MSRSRTRLALGAVSAAAALNVGLLAASASPATAAINIHLDIKGPPVKGESPA